MPTDPPSSLQFDRADFGTPAPARVVCSSCGQTVVQSYYTIGDRIVCSACRERYDDAGSELTRFLRAFLASFGVAIAGAVAWWAVGHFFKVQAALIAIAIGFGVARAIQWGTGGRTNVMYQVLAVFMTYTGIVLGYLGDLFAIIEVSRLTAGTVIRLIAIAYQAPFLQGLSNIIGLIIIAFGLWEAWKLTGAARAEIAGPFSVSPGATNV